MSAAKFAIMLCIRLYRLVISPAKMFLLGPFAQCRFSPSCSAYALEAVSRYGALLGSWLALKRVARCHPWGGCGHDPVREQSPKSNGQRPKSKGQSPRSKVQRPRSKGQGPKANGRGETSATSPISPVGPGSLSSAFSAD